MLSLAAAFAVACVGASTAQANLLNNPGFEAPLGFDFSDTSNWNGFFGGPPGTFLEAFNDTGAPAFAGAQALELTIDGAPADDGFGNGAFVGHVQTVAGASAGDTTFSIWARNNDSDVTGAVEVRLEYFSGGGLVGTDQINLEGLLTDTYQLFTLNGAAPAGTDSINAVLALAAGAGLTVPADSSVLFDNASLTVVPEPTALCMAALAGLAMVSRRRNG